VDYLALGVLFRPELLPGLTAQATVLAMYAFFGFLLRKGMRLSRIWDEGPHSSFSLDISPRRIAIAAALFTSGSLLGSLMGAGFIVALIVWIAGIIVGLVSLVYTIRSLAVTVNDDGVRASR
jgi:membrane associated rhomboid family serine protease